MKLYRFKLLILGLALATPLAAQPSQVKVEKNNAGYVLLRNGQPYLIKGGGGDGNAHTLAAIGGNSLRTWGVERAPQALEAAQREGLTLALGIWLGQQSYMDYSDAAVLEKQREIVKEAVLRFRGHPALLLWGLGNEMESGGDDSNPALWKEVNFLARMIKELDPDHPVMTVVAEVNPQKVAAILKYAPAIDILGVNSYGSALTLPRRLQEMGWDRPFVVSEFGTRGYWESPKTQWGAPLEIDSSARAEIYRQVWKTDVQDQVGRSLGGYAFIWGNKWEGTSTWFDMFLPGTGERLGAVDALQELWTGRTPAHPVPQLKSFESEAAQAEIAPSSVHRARVVASGERLRYHYEVRSEEKSREASESPLWPDCVKEDVNSPEIEFTAPSQPGAYRLFCFVYDDRGGAATANFPFLVR